MEDGALKESVDLKTALPDSEGLQFAEQPTGHDKIYVDPHDSEGLQAVEQPGRHDKYYVLPQRASFEDPEAIESHSTQYKGRFVEESKEEQSAELTSQKQRRRCCGVPPWLVVVSAITLLCIVIGAVLGGVLGSRSSHHNTKQASPSSNITTSSNSSSSSSADDLPKPLKSSGIATLSPPASENLLLYYQISNGSIIEASFPAAELNASTTNNTDIYWTIVTNAADSGSPLAVISLEDNNSTFQLFFIQDGYVSQTNRSNANETWSSSERISSGEISSGSPALCAVVQPPRYDGRRVYYGSLYGGIQEIVAPYNHGVWNPSSTNFPSGGDEKSGVACSIQTTTEDSYLNIYFRNLTTGTLQQQWWGLNDSDPGWNRGSSTAPQVLSGSSIAVESNGTATDHLLFQSQAGLQKASINTHGNGSAWFNIVDLSGAPNVSDVHAWYVAGDLMTVLPTSEGGIDVSAYSDSGALEYNSTIV